MLHKYKFKDAYIVIDVNSGAVHVVDELIYDILDYYGTKEQDKMYEVLKEKYSREKIKEALEDIGYLEKEKMLFSDDAHITDEMIYNKKPIVKALCLHVAHDCNMKCRYCFGSQGSFQGTRALMPLDVGKKSLEFLMKHSGNRRNLEVDFFGGEPLMNFDVVKELVAYGREIEKEYNKNIRFTITTNGLLLDDKKIDYINEHMENVILSIDGRPDVNDYMRRTWHDQGTYDLIIDHYTRFVDKRKDALYYVRGTFTKENLDFSKDVIFLIEQGFKNVSVEPVVVNEDIEYALNHDNLESILKEYEKLADYFIESAQKNKMFEFFHFNIDLDQGPCVIKRISGCGAGTEYLAVAPEGDLYPCHQFVGEEKFKIGNVLDIKYKNKWYDTFNAAHIFNKSDCKNCWAKFYCSGGCHANAYNINKDILKPHELGCEMEKKRIECAIGIKAVLNY